MDALRWPHRVPGVEVQHDELTVESPDGGVSTVRREVDDICIETQGALVENGAAVKIDEHPSGARPDPEAGRVVEPGQRDGRAVVGSGRDAAHRSVEARRTPQRIEG